MDTDLDELGALVSSTLHLTGANAHGYEIMTQQRIKSTLADDPLSRNDTGSGPLDVGKHSRTVSDLLDGPVYEQAPTVAVPLVPAASSNTFEEQSLLEPDDLLADTHKLNAASASGTPVASSQKWQSSAGLDAGPSSHARSEISASEDAPSHSAHQLGRANLTDTSHLASFGGQAEGPIRVTIKEPERVEGVSSLGLKTQFVTYVVHTDSDIPGFKADGMEVRRRFSDFEALHKFLKTEFRGLVIPPLPEKSFLQGKMAQDEFIKIRRADLQALLRGITRHPVLSEAEALKIFLLQPGELMRNPAWTYLIHPPPGVRHMRTAYSGVTSTDASGDTSSSGTAATTQASAAAVAANLRAGLGSWVNWVKVNVAALQPPKHELSAEEVSLRQAKELLTDLHRLLELSTETARSLCGHLDGVSGNLRELGRNFAMLSRFEEAVQSKVGQYTAQGMSAGNRATDMNKIAYGSAKQHAVWKSMSVKTAASLVVLHDWYMLLPEAVAALELREAALTQLQSLQDDLHAKQQQLDALQAGPRKVPGVIPVEKQVAMLTSSIAALEEQIKAARSDYELILKRNQDELSRLSLEREQDFRRMACLFAQTQASLVQVSADSWALLAQQFAE